MRLITFLILPLVFFISCTPSNDSSEDAHTGHSHGYNTPDEERKLDVEQVLASNPSVQVGSLQTKVVRQNVTCTGMIDVPPTELISVHSRTPGYVDLIKYIPGDYIRKGTLLFTILNPQLVEKQRILLETKAELSLAEKDFARKQKLQAENATTQKAFDEALAKKEVLSAKYLGLRSELSLLGINLSALESEQKFQSKHYIYAAESGHVHQVLANKGQMVHPDDKLMDIANNDHIHLELKVLSKDVPAIKIDQPVKFTLPNNPHVYHAEVIKLNPMIDEETGTLNVHCHIEKEHEEEMKPGMFVNAEVEVASVEVKGLPVKATVKDGERYYAFFIKEGKFVKHELKNVKVVNSFVTFDNMPEGEVVIDGAYYLL